MILRGDRSWARERQKSCIAWEEDKSFIFGRCVFASDARDDAYFGSRNLVHAFCPDIVSNSFDFLYRSVWTEVSGVRGPACARQGMDALCTLCTVQCSWLPRESYCGRGRLAQETGSKIQARQGRARQGEARRGGLGRAQVRLGCEA